MVAGWLTSVYCLCASASSPTNDVTVALMTQAGSTVVGVPEKTVVVVKAAFGEVSVPFTTLREIQHEPDKTNTVLHFKNDDRLTGIWEEKAFTLKTIYGTQQIPLSVIMSVVMRSSAVKTGLLLHYAFDGNEGEVIRDSSAMQNDGVVHGAKYTAYGRIGGAYQVGRQLGYLQAPSRDTWSFGVKPFSICLWLKLNTLPVGEQMLIAHDEGGGERNKWAFEFLSGNINFHINNQASASYRIASYPWTPQVGKWHHLAVTRNGSTYKIYVDGVRVATDQNALEVPNANAPLTIGQGEGLYIDGTIDDVMIFDHALPEDDIRAIYASAT